MPVVGIGVDLVSQRRISALLQKHGARFLSRVLHPAELDLLTERRLDLHCPGDVRRSVPDLRLVEFVSSRWAAKEAVWKVLGKRLDCRSIALLREPSGRPSLHLHGEAQSRFSHRIGGDTMHVSVSHDDGFTCCFVVAERAKG